jgi:phosphoribosylanthranilate isomerase
VTRVKICGVTSVEQAAACVDAGADAVGVNLVDESPRRVSRATARAIAQAVGHRTLLVGVVAAGLRDGFVEELRSLRDDTGLGCLQVHGLDVGGTVAALLPHAYGAVAISGLEDVPVADRMPGDYVLVDTKVDGRLGGTGRAFDWALVVGLARRRKVVLAGGLTPSNVGAAIAAVRPWCVDVASGVESAPGIKDVAKVRAFIAAARTAG